MCAGWPGKGLGQRWPWLTAACLLFSPRVAGAAGSAVGRRGRDVTPSEQHGRGSGTVRAAAAAWQQCGATAARARHDLWPSRSSAGEGERGRYRKQGVDVGTASCA